MINDKLYHIYNRTRLKLIKKSNYLSRSRYKILEENRNASDKYITHITYYQRGGNSGDTTLSQCVRRVWGKLLGIESWRIYSVNEPITNEMIRTINAGSALLIGGGWTVPSRYKQK